MGRFISISLVVLTVLMIATGIAAGPTACSGPHIAVASVWVVFAGVHAWLNRRPVVKYFKRTRLK